MLHLLNLGLVFLLAMVGVDARMASHGAMAKAAPPTARRLAVMFFGAPTANGPHHDPITRYRVLKQAFGTAGIDLTYCEDPAEAFTAERLRQFDAVLMYGNWAQNEPMHREQLLALLQWVERGGGFVPVHCASACFGGSPLFVKLVGARFASHGGEEFEVRSAVPDHPILNGLRGYKAWDETYVHSEQQADREILQMRGDEPWSWTRRHGEGRVFYTASGHDHRVWNLPEFQALLRNAVYWAVGPDKKRLLDELRLPQLETEAVSLPGYRERREITVAQKPLSPSESMKLAQVPPGMSLSLFASEPDIVNPIHIAWDHRGRAFVVETFDYPNNLQAGNLGHDRITICEDTDSDGRADKFTRFAEQLSIPTSLVFVGDGVLCTNGTELLRLVDTDGDDRADVREVLFRGFSMGDTHAGVSNLRYGFDGWIWAVIGYSGFRGEVGGARHEFAQGLFRFRPDGRELEFLQHTTNNTWGLGFTEQFDVVGSTANANPSWYFTFPARAYGAAGLDQGHTPRADDNPVFFPMSFDIRQVDQFDRYTSGAGHAVYTARRFPPEYWDRTAFVCGPTGKLVGQFVIERRGAGFRARQSPNNLFGSADAWSSPVFAEVGPDGAVWISDWYNLVVQHNPTPTKNSAGIDAATGRGNAYESPLRDQQHGRIYRVFPTGSPDDETPRLDPAAPATLLDGLAHSNLFWRLQAQRLIVEHRVTERGASELIPALRQRVAAAGIDAPHALHALAQFASLEPALLLTTLGSPNKALRRAAIAQANPNDLKAAFVAKGTIAADGRELAEILVGLSRAATDPELGTAIYETGAERGDALFNEPALRDAWMMAARRQRDGVLAAAHAAGFLVDDPKPSKNLLPNPDFEAGDGDRPEGWNEVRYHGGARGEQVEVTTSPEGRNGSKCLAIHSARRSDCGAAVTVALEPGARYRLSGWIRTENVVPVPRGPGALLNVHGGAGITGGVKGTSDWTEVRVEFDAGEERDAVIHCLFGGYGGATGTAFYDDVALVKVGGGATFFGALETLAQMPAGAVTMSAEVARKFEPDPAVHARGAEVYSRTCIACHGVDGKGVPMAFPPLDGSDWITGDARLPTKVVLHGLMGPIAVGNAKFATVMPPLGPLLDDQQIADVLTYVRQRWSNDAEPVTATEVAAVRTATKDRAQMWTAEELGR